MTEKVFTKEEAIAYEREMLTQGTLEFMFGTYTGDIFNGVLPIRKGKMEYKNGITVEHSVYGIDFHPEKVPEWNDDNLFLFKDSDEGYVLKESMWDIDAWEEGEYGGRIDYERIEEEGRSFFFDYRNKVANECHKSETGHVSLFRGIPAGYPKFAYMRFDKFTMPENNGERIEYTDVYFHQDGRSGSYYHLDGDNGCEGYGDYDGAVCLGYPVDHDQFLKLRDLAMEKGVYGADEIEDASGYNFESHGNIRTNYVYGHLLLSNGDIFRGYILLGDGRGHESEAQKFLDPVMLGGEYFNCRKKAKVWEEFGVHEELYMVERNVGYRIDAIFEGKLYDSHDEYYNGCEEEDA